MKLVLLFLVLAAGAASGREPNCELKDFDEGQFEPKIIDGSIPASIDVFPFLAQLTNGTEHLCGASIIEEQYVLTAAHCVFFKEKGITEEVVKQKFRIAIGHYNLSVQGRKENPGTFYAIEDFEVKGEFESAMSPMHDLAVIRLNSSISLRDDGKLPTKIELADEKFRLECGMHLDVAGWGRYRFGKSDILRMAKVKIIGLQGDSNCVIERSENDTDICVEPWTGIPFLGDSGGPFVYYGVDRKPIQVAVHSQGDGRKNLLPFVGKNVEWIREAIANLDERSFSSGRLVKSVTH